MNETRVAGASEATRFERLGGVAGLVFAAGVVLQNGFLLSGSPLPDAAIGDVRSFYADGELPIAIATGLVALNVVLLLVFGSTVAERLARHESSRVLARAGFGAIVLLCGAFLTTTFLQAVLASRVERLAEDGQLALIWDLHNAAFVMSATSLGAVLAAFSLGAFASGDVVPRWMALIGLGGSVCLLLAGGLVVSTVGGGPGIFLQLLGFVVWLIWLVTASVGLLRDGTGAA